MEGPSLTLFLTKLATWVFYPFSLAGLVLLATLCCRGVRRPVRAGIAVALVLLWGGGCRLTSEHLVRSLESYSRPPAPGVTADAIVVLGGGLQPPVPPRRAVEVSEAGDRVLEAARLWHEERSAVVVASGGRFDRTARPRAEAADAAELLQVLGVPAEAILEQPGTRTTHEEAIAVRRLLAARGIDRILLVTSALHMRRACALFRAQGLEVIPAPTDFVAVEVEERSRAMGALTLLPRAESLVLTTRALHEWLGLAAARLAGQAA